MDTLEWNKVIGAVLVTALTLKAIDVGVDHLRPHGATHAEKAFPVAVEEGEETAAKPAEGEKKGPAVEPIAPLLAAASPDEGQAVFRKCAICHTLEKGGANKVGPNLWGVVGRGKGEESDFNYSSAMKNAGGQWTYEDLNKYLADPKAYIPGNKMAFAGLKSAQDRANVIALLRQSSDNPPPLP